MIGLGIIINTVAVILGGFIGMGLNTAAHNTGDLVRALGGIEKEANTNKDISK